MMGSVPRTAGPLCYTVAMMAKTIAPPTAAVSKERAEWVGRATAVVDQVDKRAAAEG